MNKSKRDTALLLEKALRERLAVTAEAFVLADGLNDDDGKVCATQFVNFDEQDMLNAFHIFYSVCYNYAFKKGILTHENIDKKNYKFLKTVYDTFGLDVYQEWEVKQTLNAAKDVCKTT